MSMIKLDMHKSQRITDSGIYTKILFTLKCRNLRYHMGQMFSVPSLWCIVASDYIKTLKDRAMFKLCSRTAFYMRLKILSLFTPTSSDDHPPRTSIMMLYCCTVAPYTRDTAAWAPTVKDHISKSSLHLWWTGYQVKDSSFQMLWQILFRGWLSSRLLYLPSLPCSQQILPRPRKL